MIPKLQEKEKAVLLRKEGLTYSEILSQIPVAKSTLALWFQSLGLSKVQKQRLTERKLLAIKRGGLAKRNIRLAISKKIISEAESQLNSISKRELWIIGTSLYWAEGSKEKEGRLGSGVQFMNHDLLMIKLFLKWLTEVCKISRERIGFGLYIHEYRKPDIAKVVEYWSYHTGFPKAAFGHIYYKRNVLNTKRKNIGDKYFGSLKIGVSASSELNRKIQGWVNGICKNCRVV